MIGPTELAIVAAVALVVFGPKRLPEMGQKIGQALREFTSATSEIRSQIGADEIAESVADIRSSLSLKSDSSRAVVETVRETPVDGPSGTGERVDDSADPPVEAASSAASEQVEAGAAVPDTPA